MKYKIVACVYICLLLASCNQVAETTWQEQYGLGVRFLSEGNYEESCKQKSIAEVKKVPQNLHS